MACCLNGVGCVEAVGREGHLTEVAAHHISQGGHTQAVVVVGGAVNLVLVNGDACTYTSIMYTPCVEEHKYIVGTCKLTYCLMLWAAPSQSVQVIGTIAVNKNF